VETRSHTTDWGHRKNLSFGPYRVEVDPSLVERSDRNGARGGHRTVSMDRRDLGLGACVAHACRQGTPVARRCRCDRCGDGFGGASATSTCPAADSLLCVPRHRVVLGTRRRTPTEPGGAAAFPRRP
jgi:hypothetical protein